MFDCSKCDNFHLPLMNCFVKMSTGSECQNKTSSFFRKYLADKPSYKQPTCKLLHSQMFHNGYPTFDVLVASTDKKDIVPDSYIGSLNAIHQFSTDSYHIHADHSF